MIEGRRLEREELDRIWEIDRTELVEAVYVLVDGELALQRQRHDVRGWPPGEAEKYAPILADCFDRGSWFHGLFDGPKLIGTAALDGRFIGGERKQLQLAFLHVSARHRDRGLGRRLFTLAADEARRRRARALYISATPSQHTIDFYLGLCCVLAREVDPQLFELEPEDIHLEYELGSRAV